jgi:hypothetical protein
MPMFFCIEVAGVREVLGVTDNPLIWRIDGDKRFTLV